MCQNGYDYCGPVFDSTGSSPDFLTRHGSILAPPSAGAIQEEMILEEPTEAGKPSASEKSPASSRENGPSRGNDAGAGGATKELDAPPLNDAPRAFRGWEKTARKSRSRASVR